WSIVPCAQSYSRMLLAAPTVTRTWSPPQVPMRPSTRVRLGATERAADPRAGEDTASREAPETAAGSGPVGVFSAHATERVRAVRTVRTVRWLRIFAMEN